MVSRATKRLSSRYLLWGGILAAFAALIFLGHGVWGVYGKLGEATEGRVDAEEGRESLVRRKSDLEGSLAALATARGVEGEIRSRYPMVKPGETEFVLIDTATTSQNQETVAKQSWWVRLWEALF